MLHQVVYPRDEVKQQPHHHNGREPRAKLGGSKRLDGEQGDEDGARDAHNGRPGERRIRHGNPLDGAQHRLRGREHAVSKDQTDAQDADGLERELGGTRALEEGADAARGRTEVVGGATVERDGGEVQGGVLGDVGEAGEERVERKGAALAVVVGAEDDEGVFDGDDEGQGPDDDGEGADEVVPRGLGGEG